MSEKNSLVVQVMLLTIIGLLVIGGLAAYTFFPERDGIFPYCSAIAAVCFAALTQVQKAQSDKVQKATHDLVNSAKLLLEKQLMMKSEQTANLTGADSDIADARESRTNYENHQAKQDKVDDDVPHSDK